MRAGKTVVKEVRIELIERSDQKGGGRVAPRFWFVGNSPTWSSGFWPGAARRLLRASRTAVAGVPRLCERHGKGAERDEEGVSVSIDATVAYLRCSIIKCLGRKQRKRFESAVGGKTKHASIRHPLAQPRESDGMIREFRSPQRRA